MKAQQALHETNELLTAHENHLSSLDNDVCFALIQSQDKIAEFLGRKPQKALSARQKIREKHPALYVTADIPYRLNALLNSFFALTALSSKGMNTIAVHNVKTTTEITQKGTNKNTMMHTETEPAVEVSMSELLLITKQAIMELLRLLLLECHTKNQGETKSQLFTSAKNSPLVVNYHRNSLLRGVSTVFHIPTRSDKLVKSWEKNPSNLQRPVC